MSEAPAQGCNRPAFAPTIDRDYIGGKLVERSGHAPGQLAPRRVGELLPWEKDHAPRVFSHGRFQDYEGIAAANLDHGDLESGSSGGLDASQMIGRRADKYPAKMRHVVLPFFRTSRISTPGLRPRRLGFGSNGAIRSHSSSVRSLG